MIPLMRNTFLHEEETRQQLAKFILEAPKFSMGEQCEHFEHEFAKYQGRDFAVLFNSGASANLALIQVCKNLRLLTDGDTVGFSALTWSTNVMPLIQLGLQPVPIDCDRRTLNSMSSHLRDRIKTRPLKALFITNALGFAGDLGQIRELCRAEGIILLEDNCEALGTDLPEGRTGNFGLASTFSFFVAHHMSTIEGGMVCTDDPEVAEMLKIVRANGWDRNLSPQQQQKWRALHKVESEFYAKYAFYDLAYNLRPTEITGFLGRCQLQYLDYNIAKRTAIYRAVNDAVNRNGDFIPLELGHIQRFSSFGLPFVCATRELRDFYTQRFSDAGVEIRPMIAGNIQKQPFYSRYVAHDYPLPDAQFLHDCGFYCGNYPEMSEEDVDLIRRCVTSQALSPKACSI
jgi:CDP-4-dehydro-6-deoxyglucose reductase, E1